MKLITALLFAISWPAFAQTLEIVSPEKRVSFTLSELKSRLKSETVTLDDPVYGKKMSYDAFALDQVLALAGASPGDKADELVFTAQDGYSPNMSFAWLKNLKGYMAYQEHGFKGRFPLVAQGKAKLSPGPFYVVWVKTPDLKGDVPWPYQLVKIEVVDWNRKYARVVPPKAAADSKERKGFELFKAECIRCHSINLQGGDVGPELNVPRNVTEYWRPEVLREFIHDAPSFRAKSKMPAFTGLKDEQIDALIRYIAYMKDFKVAQP